MCRTMSKEILAGLCASNQKLGAAFYINKIMRKPGVIRCRLPLGVFRKERNVTRPVNTHAHE